MKPSPSFDKSEIAISFICIGIFIFMIPTLFYLLGKPLEAVIFRREIRDFLKRINVVDNKEIKGALRTLAIKQEIKVLPHNERTNQELIPIETVFRLFSQVALIFIIIGLLIHRSIEVLKSVILIVSVFILIEVIVLVTLGLLYRPLDILNILHSN